MNKQKVLGITLTIISIILTILLVRSGYHVEQEKKSKQTAQTTEQITGNIITETTDIVETVTEEITTVQETTEKITVSDDKEVELINELKIRDVNSEVLELLECDDKKIAETIQIFANGYGYAGAKKVVYAGICTINHNENTKEATFYFLLSNRETVYFDLIFNRKKGTYSCELQ